LASSGSATWFIFPSSVKTALTGRPLRGAPSASYFKAIEIWPAFCVTVIAIGGSPTPLPMPPLAAIWLFDLSKFHVPAKLGIGAFGFGLAAATVFGDARRTVLICGGGVFG